MPRITQYVAPTKDLTPSTRGTQAFEQAGRRLGPLYNEAAQFQKDQGTIAEQENKELLWPYDIARLNDKQPQGIGFKTEASGTGRGGSGRGATPSYAATGQISRGAGALGNALSDGGYQVAGDNSIGANGLSNAANKAMAAYNSAQDAYVSQNTADAVNQSNYNLQFRGADPFQTDTSNVSSAPITDPMGAAYSTAGNTDTTGQSIPGAASDQPAPSDSSGGMFSGLSNWIDNAASATTATSDSTALDPNAP